jgi:hypothetical protein
MKNKMIRSLAISLFLLHSIAGSAEQPAPLTPAEIQLRLAKANVASGTKPTEALVELASAQINRGRETSDLQHLRDALTTLKPVREKDKESFDADKLRVAAWLELGEFDAAYSTALALNKKVPDDSCSFGIEEDRRSRESGTVDVRHAAAHCADLLRRRVGARGFERCFRGG